jgi:hypothetical protein
MLAILSNHIERYRSTCVDNTASIIAIIISSQNRQPPVYPKAFWLLIATGYTSAKRAGLGELWCYATKGT